MTHIYATPACSFWEQLGAKVRLLKCLLKNRTTNHVMDQVCSTLATMTAEIHQWHPAPCELQKPTKLQLLIEKLLSEKLVKYANGAILLTNDCLARAVKGHGKIATRNYDFSGKLA